MLHGHPGLGKSDLIREVADQFKLKLIDFRASQMDPTDVNGFGTIIKNGNEAIAKYIPFDVFPLEGTPVPKGYNGFCLFFDELNACSKSVEAALYKVLLDRMIGQKKLHPKTAMVCAGNLVNSGAIVNRQGTATQSRMIHLTLSVDPIGWIEWASKNNLDFRVISYISNFPDKLHDFDPKHTDKTFACPRTWFYVSKILKIIGDKPLKNTLANLAGAVGEPAARQFILFSETLTELPSIKEIESNPFTTSVSAKPSLLHAVTHLIAAHLSEKNIDRIINYINRMPVEFQTICLQNCLYKNRELINHDLIQNWIIEKGELLL
jgi:hypothetical protein